LLEARYKPSSPSIPLSPPSDATNAESKGKGKGKEVSSDTALTWMRDYLISLTGAMGQADRVHGSFGHDAGFGETLVKVMSFCFSEMQHVRLAAELRAAIAKAGFEVST
jgi:hypothetical protein